MSTKNAGITLIEAVVAIVILSFTLSASSALMITTSRQSAKNKERTMATYLAQECMELSRNVRDTAWRKFERWDCAFFDDTAISGQKEKLIINATDPTVDFAISNCGDKNFYVNIQNYDLAKAQVKIREVDDENNVNYIHSQFHRYLEAEKLTEDTIKITCHVKWGSDNHVSMAQILTNWKRQ